MVILLVPWLRMSLVKLQLELKLEDVEETSQSPQHTTLYICKDCNNMLQHELEQQQSTLKQFVAL